MRACLLLRLLLDAVGWPAAQVDDRTELQTLAGLFYRGRRVVVPLAAPDDLLRSGPMRGASIAPRSAAAAVPESSPRRCHDHLTMVFV